MKYIHLIEKNKGRIKKNEEYDITELVRLLYIRGLFKGTWTLNKRRLINNLISIINQLINEDN